MNTVSVLKDRTFQIVFLLYSSLLIFLGRQADAGLLNFDDSFHAQKAKELLAGGSLWLNTFHGQPVFDKPPLTFWLTALAFEVFGVSGYSAVLVTGLLGTGVVYITYRLAEKLFQDPWVAFLAGIVLIFPGYFLDYSRRGMTDIALTFFITLALYCFFLARENPRWYLAFGFSTVGAILTKSVLGLFPLLIALGVLVLSRRWKTIANPNFVAGMVIALGLGSVWHIINWMEYGDRFIHQHFGWLIWERFLKGDPATPNASPFYFLGYLKGFFGNYWPWLPIAVVGCWQFGKKAVAETGGHKDRYLLVLLWVGIILVVLSMANAQYFRYMLPVFPALAIIVSKTLGNWLLPVWQDKALSGLVGVVMITVFFINATPIEMKQAASLRRNSWEVRLLAPAIRLNTVEQTSLGNYRLPLWHPRNSILFYSDRWLADPVTAPEQVMASFDENPQATWLSRLDEYGELEEKYPGRLYLIQSQAPYAYFTSMQVRDRISYDFSGESNKWIR
ncbi:MAG: glycosyltransferase family 39 protein [Nitrospinota bacterium]|nr:glycosyltransferase family 39 protein [Nitrospinota bacterium]